MSLIVKTFFKVLKNILLIILYLAFIVILFQDLLFFPYVRESLYQNDVKPEHGERVELIRNNAQIIESWVKESAIQPSKGLCLIFRGNSNDLNYHWNLPDWCSEKGYKAVIFNYPGMGLSSGWPSERTIAEAAERVYKNFYSSGDLIVLGYSIGTGPATEFSVKHPPKELLLFAPYPGLKSIVSTRTLYRYLVWFSKYDFPAKEYIKKLSNTKLFVLTGGEDDVIPNYLSDEVYDAYNGPKIRINNPKIGHGFLLGGNLVELNKAF